MRDYWDKQISFKLRQASILAAYQYLDLKETTTWDAFCLGLQLYLQWEELVCCYSQCGYMALDFGLLPQAMSFEDFKEKALLLREVHTEYYSSVGSVDEFLEYFFWWYKSCNILDYELGDYDVFCLENLETVCCSNLYS